MFNLLCQNKEVIISKVRQQPERYIYSNKEPVHSIMEAKFRPRRTDGIFQSESEGPRTRKAGGGKFQSEAKSKGRRRLMSQPKEFFLTQPFILFGPSRDWLRLTHTGGRGQSVLLSLLIQSHPEAPSQTHAEVMFNQIPGHSMAQSS